LSIYPKRTKLICTDSKIGAGEKKKIVSLFASFIFADILPFVTFAHEAHRKAISSFFLLLFCYPLLVIGGLIY
jgi:hypothetical protein